MNRFFLSIGLLLLLALTTALVAPRFIDWSNYTDVIEEQASRLLGRDVHVSGAVDLRLLPMPRITFSDIEIASRQDGSAPEVEVARMEALLSLAPFLRGEAEIVELTLDQPVVRLSALAETTATGDDDGLDLGAIRVEDATIRDGRVERIAPDGSVQVLVDELNASMSASSLLGPWRVDPASAIIDGERVSLRLQSGAYAGDRRMRLRVSVLPVNRPLEITVDGHFDWSGIDAHFEGQARANSLALPGGNDSENETPQLTWQIGATIDAALEELRAQDIDISLGLDGDQAFVLNGHARVSLGEQPAFNAALSSRQVDLDRMLGGGPSEPVDLGAGWTAADTLVRWIERATVPGDVSFDIPAIVLGGSVIRDIGFDATYRPDIPISLDNLVATFPGDTAFGFTGAIRAAEPSGLALDGVMSLSSVAPDLFIGWSTGRSDEGGTFSQLSDIELSGRIIADPSEVILERLRGQIDGDALIGYARYQAPSAGGDSGRLELNLDAGRFDFGLLAGFGNWLTSEEDAGLTLGSVDANLSVESLVAGAENLGQVDVDLTATRQRVRIDQLSIGDAAGARLVADGFFDRGAFPPVGAMSITADVDRLRGLMRLVRDVTGDHPILADLERNAGLYEPAAIVGTYANDDATGLQLGLNGTLGGTDFNLRADMPSVDGSAALPSGLTATVGLADLFARAAEFTFTANTEDAFVLVGQLGVPALPLELEGGGSVSATLVSDGQSAPQVRFAFDGLDTVLRLDGVLVAGQTSQQDGQQTTHVAGLEGTGSVFAGDVAQLGLMAGMALPGLFDPIGVSAGFDVVYDQETQSADLTAVQGQVADVPIAGTARIDRTPLGVDIALDLAVDRVDLPSVLSAFVGPSAFDQGFAEFWPEGPLAFNAWPLDVNMQLETPRLALWDGVNVLNSNMDLRIGEGEVTLDSLSGQVYGGVMDARLVLRDADRGTLANGRLSISDVELSQLSWQRAGQPVLNGDGSLSMTFETSGVSMASMMAGLTGEGTLAVSNASVSGLGLDGFARILQASDAGLLGDDADLGAAFSDALRAGTMSIAQANAPISLVGGTARASNVFLQGEATALRGGWSLDLSTHDLDADFSYAATNGPGDVEAMPNVGLSFTGDFAQPERELDVSQISSFLNVRQLENEIRRVEALNAEILERERLLRIMAAVELDEARLVAVAEEEARQELLRQEELRLEQQRLEADQAAEAEAARDAAQQAAQEAAEAARQALEEQEQQAEEAAEAERLRVEQEQAAREEALRQALQAREDALRQEELRVDPNSLSVDLPPLGEPIIVERNPLSLGESPPPATSGPLILAPLDLSPPN